MDDMITDDEVRANIAANINRLLEDRGWSRAELARKTGDNQVTINLICNGRHVPRSGLLARIAEAFDVSMDRLAAEVPEKISAA
jgi:transcriptional regulator with XRE-family HTH domain